MKASIVIRTYNEEKHLDELLHAISIQKAGDIDVETILVDSGSTDNTLKIAQKYDVKIVHIKKEDFTFGRALNVGCEAASGEFLIFVSGHCIPCKNDWLKLLVQPLSENQAVYSYGGQVGNEDSYFSERQLFEKYFPATSMIPQEGYFCNNANSALLTRVWENDKFDEALTGLEDMHLSKSLVSQGEKIAYVAEAAVFHLHEETWHKVKIRYEREAIALRQMMPEVHVHFKDFLRYFFSAVFYDMAAAIQQKVLVKNLFEIFMFRLMQYWGSYRGNHEHRRLCTAMKEEYFYPK